jgi:hypothetical protein
MTLVALRNAREKARSSKSQSWFLCHGKSNRERVSRRDALPSAYTAETLQTRTELISDTRHLELPSVGLFDISHESIGGREEPKVGNRGRLFRLWRLAAVGFPRPPGAAARCNALVKTIAAAIGDATTPAFPGVREDARNVEASVSRKVKRAPRMNALAKGHA